MKKSVIRQISQNIEIIVDTREQETKEFEVRIKSMNAPIIRKKLEFGDYSAVCTAPNGQKISFEKKISIERKMSIEELCNCFCNGRERFEAEFERAKAVKAKMYLLIENASWEKIHKGEYKSRMTSEALIASLETWEARYNCPLIFCSSSLSGIIIKNHLSREVKEILRNIKSGENG
jgi:ERCC4-type nuclease